MLHRFAFLLVLPFFFLAGCYTVSVPLDNQRALDNTGLILPDTHFPSIGMEQTVLPILQKQGFHWNDPRYSMGHHLISGNRLVVVAGDGTITVLRYIARFRDSGFLINRYQPTKSGDLMQKGTTVEKRLLGCVYNRPGTTFGSYAKISFPTFLADGLFAGAINTFLFPVLVTWCETIDRLPLTYHSMSITPDEQLTRLLNNLRTKGKTGPVPFSQNGNPIPTKVTTPASVE
ncbi:MAG: hypothetical protein ACYCYP_02005 [Leptospirales bacterium]